MEQPYRANVLIVKGVGMLPGASAEYASQSMNVQHIKKRGCVVIKVYGAASLYMNSEVKIFFRR
ncbi:MAG: hypothetical protein K2F70_03185, partial [Muribaculaceae bacterium]|nr:hypothetical protein [Muribaculaceae bacterium]